MTTRLRYAIIGTGARAQLYVDAIIGPHANVAQLVAWSDANPGRLDWYERHVTAAGATAPARFEANDLADAVREHRLDRVIVTSPDLTHARHIVAGLDAGADVVVEKPLTTNTEGVRLIADAVQRTGRKVIVTFNYRYSPRNSLLRQIIAAGEIGEVTSIRFEWLLDTVHGADYFRRWHRQKGNSGGLLVHKATHHFDLAGWWLSDVPTRVFASGGLRFYGAENAARRGLADRPERGTVDGMPHDPFRLDLRSDPLLQELFLDQEHHDGYLRDRDPFGPGIDIEDNLAVIVDYHRGATMSYSLNAHAPWEGYAVAINGTAGRAELTVVERGAVIVGDDGRIVLDPTARPDRVDGEVARPIADELVVQKHFAIARRVDIPGGVGGHGGGDVELLRDVFVGDRPDPLVRAASWHDGVRSVAVGLAANRSLETGMPVDIRSLELGAGRSAFG